MVLTLAKSIVIFFFHLRNSERTIILRHFTYINFYKWYFHLFSIIYTTPPNCVEIFSPLLRLSGTNWLCYDWRVQGRTEVQCEPRQAATWAERRIGYHVCKLCMNWSNFGNFKPEENQYDIIIIPLKTKTLIIIFFLSQ